MGMLRLRPWPFKKYEEVELYWLGSVFQSPTHQWYIRCVFKATGGEYKEIELPWGTLPGLIIGRRYTNGVRSLDLPMQESMQVDIPADTEFDICTCSEVPKGLYNLKSLKENKLDLLCKFQVGTYTYYIPCVEIIRSILAPFQVLANQILKPNGLDDFFEGSRFKEDVYEVDLSRDFPRKMLKSHIVGYFVWLKENEKAYSEWSAVYQNLLLSSYDIAPVLPTLALSTGVPIKAIPPINVDCNWKFYGKKYKQSYFIQELIYHDGVDSKYIHIKYSHYTQENLNKVNKPRNTRTVITGKSKNNKETTIDKNRLPSSRRKTITAVERPTVNFRFHQFTICEKNRKHIRNVNNGEYKNSSSGVNNATSKRISIGTTQDWTLEGKLNSIEFNTLELVKDNPQRGLEKFFKVLLHIKKYISKLDFEISVVHLPLERVFSQNDNGFKRTCCIVKVYKEKGLQCYILEFSRSDEWPISTIYIWPLSPLYDDRDFESVLSILLNSAIDNSGHWDNEVISSQSDFRFEMTKHVPGQSIERWAEIVVENIII